jgi:nicotinamidase/pyrazinamidase
MGTDVVVVVDMLRGFLEPGRALYCGDRSRDIIPRVTELLTRKRDQGAPLLYLADNHAPDDKEFLMFPPHCIRGTEESELIPELLAFPGAYIPKTRFSGFYGTNLDEILADLAPELVTVVGVCTDICVMHTVADLRNRDYAVEVPRRCVASFDEEAHTCALRHMEKILGARIV